MVKLVRATAGDPQIPGDFPILLNAEMAIIEPAFAWLIEHATLRGRGRASETVRTYGEHLYDWFDTLEQSGLAWDQVEERVIAAYRNRMLEGPSSHTGRPYARTTINARVHTVCRFYAWAHDRGLIEQLPYTHAEHMLLDMNGPQPGLRPVLVNRLTLAEADRLPRPLRPAELERLFANLGPTPRLAAEWALTAGLRRKEICGLTVDMIPDSRAIHPEETPLVGVPLAITKGDYPRTVYPPLKLIDRTHWYIGDARARIVKRHRRRDPRYRPPPALLLGNTGAPITKKRLTAMFAEGFAAAGVTGTLHWLRHTFAMAMLARLQIQARDNPDLNPLKIVQVLMGHRSITTTAIYLRCVELHERDLSESLAWFYGELVPDAG